MCERKKKMIHLQNNIFDRKDDVVYCWLFNIGIEQGWTTNCFKIKDGDEERVVQHMEEIMLFLCKEQDILLLRQMPDIGFLEHMQRLGFAIPQIFCPKRQDNFKTITDLVLEDKELIAKLQEYAKKTCIYLIPYGVTEKEERLGKTCEMTLKGSSAYVSYKVNSKLYARKLAQKLHISCPEGIVCSSIEEVENSWNKLHKQFGRVVIKQIYGASGQGLHLVDDYNKLKRILHILKRSEGEMGQWIVEGWYEEKKDLNAQLYLHEDGQVEVFSVNRQLLEETIYRGSTFPFALPQQEMNNYIEQIERAGAALYEEGVRGVVGIDSILTGKQMFPIIEINVRFTLSTYLSVLPRMFSNRCFQSIYYRMTSCDELTYVRLEERLRTNKLLFDTAKKKGIFFYNQGCMNKKMIGKVGRLFLVIVGEEWREVEKMQIEVEKMIRKEE